MNRVVTIRYVESGWRFLTTFIFRHFYIYVKFNIYKSSSYSHMQTKMYWVPPPQPNPQPPSSVISNG